MRLPLSASSPFSSLGRPRQVLRELGPSSDAGRLLARLSRPWVREADRQTYLALAELWRRYSETEGPTPSPRQPLTGYELRVFSQNGEDGVLAEILRRASTAERWFVEFGVENGVQGNCVFLADVMDWSGLFMEAQQDAFAELHKKYAANSAVRTRQAFVGPDNIENLLAQAGAPRELDVLSIDVDGNDYWVWEALSSYAPRIVIIEYNSHWPLDRRWVQPYDPESGWLGTDHYGASLGALRALGEKKGYRLVHTELTGVNAFFVRADIQAVMPAPEVVPLRAPNFFLSGASHPAHPAPAPPVIELDA